MRALASKRAPAALRALGALALAACAASLQVTPADPGSPPKGIRVHSPVPYKVTKRMTYENPECERDVETIVYLPTGLAYDIDFRPSPLGTTQFSVTLHDSGTLKQVTLNSDPAASATLEAAGEVAAGLVPLAAAAAACGPVKSETILGLSPLLAK